MAAESNVGARLLLIGKDGVLAGIREITAATAQLNAEIARGAEASRVAAGGYAEQGAGLEALQAKMTAYEAQLGAVNAETDALARVGKVAFYTMAAAGAAWTYESIKWAQNYQTELVRLRTQAGLTARAMNQVGAAAMKNAAALGTTPTAYLQAAYHPASTGMSTRQVISITNYAAMASAMSGAPLEATTNALTGVMKAYGYKGSGEHTTALLNAIVGAGNMRYSDLNAALGSGIASVAKTYGVSLTSMGGALARLTDVGTPPAQAGTHLRMALALLGAPTAISAKLLTAAGMGTSQATAASSGMAAALVAAGLKTTQVSAALRNNSGAGGIYNALALLHSHLSGLSPEVQGAMISRAFGGGRMGTAIMQLYSNLPQLAFKSHQIGGNATNQRFMSDWSKTTGTLTFQLHRLGGELETLGTKFGNTILPVVTEGVKVFGDFLDIIGKNKALIILLGGAITAVLVPAIGVYLKRALLSSQGSIMAVLRAYQRLIFGQSEEDAALVREDKALSVNDAALQANAGAQEADNVAHKGGIVPVGGRGVRKPSTPSTPTPVAGTGGSGFLAALGLAGAAYVTAHQTHAMAQHKPVWDPFGITKYFRASEITRHWDSAVGWNPHHNYWQNTEHIGHNLTHDFASVRHETAHLFDDIFGGGGGGQPQAHTLPRGVIRNQVYVYIDGKQIKDAVVKYTRSQAARS